MSLQFSDVVRGAELPHYYASTAKGRINFVFHHVSDRPYFFETSSIQFYKNTDTNTLMIKDFSFPLYNGNNEFFSCDRMLFRGFGFKPSFDYYVSGLYPEVDYGTASSTLKVELDSLKETFVDGDRPSFKDLSLNLNNNGNPFASLAPGSLVAVSGFTNLFLVNKAYSLHLSSFKIIVFYELWSINFASSKLNEVFLQRLFCPTSLLDRANLDDAKQYKEAVLLRYVFGGNNFEEVTGYQEEDGVDFKIGIANVLDTPHMDTL